MHELQPLVNPTQAHELVPLTELGDLKHDDDDFNVTEDYSYDVDNDDGNYDDNDDDSDYDDYVEDGFSRIDALSLNTKLRMFTN